MRIALAAVGLLFTLTIQQRLQAQGAQPDLETEVAAVRATVARSHAGLRQYKWVEHTEVLVKGDVKSSTDLNCHFNNDGELVKTPVSAGKEMDDANAISKRPRVRKKADMQDYIGRAVSMIQQYVPPRPDQIDHMLRNGGASLGLSDNGMSQMKFKDYFQTGDSMVFTYNPLSKELLKVTVMSTLGSPKDPVTMQADFQFLPDGVNHLASTTLIAKAKKVEVRMKNLSYQKLKN